MSTINDDATDTKAVITAVREGAKTEIVGNDDVYGVTVPDGADYKIVDPYKLLDAPQRKQGAYKVSTVDAFVDYVKAHEQQDATTVWVHPTSGKVVAVLDDHEQGAGKGDPGWRVHTVALELIKADEWVHWTKLDGTLVSQQQFAEHIEDGAGEIVRPDAATMLELAQSFHATTNADFQSGTRLSDGEIKFTYNEETQATAGRSRDLEIPDTFDLSIRPFLGEQPVDVLARLRYRVRGGDLAIGYKLDRPEIVVRNVLDRVASGLADELANVYVGPDPL